MAQQEDLGGLPGRPAPGQPQPCGYLDGEKEHEAQVGRGASQRPPGPGVDQRRPLAKLGVEVCRGREPPARQERGLQVAIGPLDQALSLWVRGLADHHLGVQGAAECLALRRQLRLPGPPPADRALAVPDQRPRHPAQRGDQLPPARGQVRRVTRGNQHRRQPPRITRDHRQHRQPLRPAFLPGPGRHDGRREPEVAQR